MKSLTVLLFTLIFTYSQAQTVSNVAGMPGVVGFANGQAAASSFNNPHGVACDWQGNIYVANRFGHTIRKITPTGIVSVFAGSGSVGSADGQGIAASFNEPWAVACDTTGNVYVADTKNYKIRKINPSGVVTTVAGTGVFGVTNGAATIAQFGFPTGLAVNNDGSVIYVADRMTHTIRKIEAGVVSTIAGVVYSPGDVDGTGAAAKFDHPYSLALDPSGNVLVADEYNNKIKRVTPLGVVTTIAGNGSMGNSNGAALSASFNAPWGICSKSNGDIFIGDANNFTVRKLSGGVVTVYAGQDGSPGMANGPALQSSFNGVSALAHCTVDDALYLCDPYSQLVRKITPLNSTTLTLTAQGGSTSYCAGTTVIFNASPGTLSNYILREGATILGNSGNGTFSIQGLTLGNHSIYCTAIDGSGLTVTSNTITITITSALSVSIIPTGSTSICTGDSVLLSSSVAGNYQWSTGATSASISVSSSGTYILTVTNSQGCSGQSAPLQITTLQAPLATITSASQAPVCAGDSVLLTAGSASTFQWSNGAISQTTYATSPGNFTVLVTSGAGCSAISLPMTVVFYPATSTTITPSGNVLLPQGSSIILSANAGSSYLWSTGALTQNITVNAPGTYTVTVTDQNGCLSSPAVSQVSYISPSNMISVNGPSAFCEGDSVVLSSVFTSDNQWFRDGNPIAGAVQSDYTAKISGYYKVRNTPVSGTPVFSDSIQVTVRTIPNTVTAYTDTVCKGTSATLNVLPQTGITYNWYDNSTGGFSLGTGLSFNTPPLQQSNSYYIELTNSYGCVRANRFEVMALLLPQPVAWFNASASVQTTSGYEIAFSNGSAAADLYYWDFGDAASSENNSSDANPVHIFSQTGDYIITLIASNTDGCTDTLVKTVSVRMDNNLFIPSGFTPNNDGNNDYFRVRGNNILATDISIFNQWGQRMWHGVKETGGWDGTSNGEIVNNGSYAYAIEVTFDNGSKQFFRGNINVIR
ncbi:MAG: gliding motility-associated C-terminal domain-containing protein [Bacteroidota bacterium]|nr:gliding motility-associated C-terminal domain-containing protein [Bacteroidota bacterium]